MLLIRYLFAGYRDMSKLISRNFIQTPYVDDANNKWDVVVVVVVDVDADRDLPVHIK